MTTATNIELRDYQQRAVEFLSRRRRGLVQSPAGSGKTIIAAAAIRTVIHRKPRFEPVRVGWLANTKEQVEQGRTAVETVMDDMALIDLRIACAAGNPDMSDRDVLIVDECQHALAPQWAAIIAGCPGAVWGFSATPFATGDPEDRFRMIDTFKDVMVIEREEVGALAAARVIMLEASDPDLQEPIDAEINRIMAYRRRFSRMDEGQLWSQVAFQVCVDMGVVANGTRNEAVCRTANRHIMANDSTLVLIQKIDHGRELAERINGAVLCHSKMGDKKRKAAIEGFRNGDLRCIIATSLADEGLDVPRANVLILAGAGKAAGRIEQRTGRVLRSFEGKTRGLIYDFKDTHHPLLASQARKRIALYQQLNYEIVRGAQHLFSRPGAAPEVPTSTSSGRSARLPAGH